MILGRLQRAGLLVLGAAVLGLGVTASILEWPAAGVISLILPALLVLIFAILGVFPNVHLKEGNIDWPKSDELTPAKTWEQVKEENAQIRKELAAVRARLEDYILASEPEPDDGLTDEERLKELQEGYHELYEDVSYRRFMGEDYDDGISTDELSDIRDRVRAALDREEQRQQARFTFGLKASPPKELP